MSTSVQFIALRKHYLSENTEEGITVFSVIPAEAFSSLNSVDCKSDFRNVSRSKSSPDAGSTSLLAGMTESSSDNPAPTPTRSWTSFFFRTPPAAQAEAKPAAESGLS
ncbi:MAG: hypothetical protein A3J38_00385 [Gammaproteobacteria bacterium RIFCSPHIGHO2_12_FULL_45_9]|nr:MAG: hypothetical protein A3J38_00385 [Gammaproteobacteria bacterium RIFCSPHIGHO2_12_FULL_45_9]